MQVDQGTVAVPGIRTAVFGDWFPCATGFAEPIKAHAALGFRSEREEIGTDRRSSRQRRDASKKPDNPASGGDKSKKNGS